MGLVKVAINSLSGGFKDQWLEIIEPDELNDSTVMTKGVLVRKNEKRNSNQKGTSDVITDGSVVHVYPNSMMLLIDGGKIIDYTAEEGYFTIKNELAPSMFSGDLKGAIEESFNRFKFGGMTPQKQKIIYINLQEIKGIKFGTASPINYFDNFYKAELFLKVHGSYSIKIVDPILFYSNVLPKNKDQVEINDINDQFLSEFLTALQTSINQMSVVGERISYISSKSVELSQLMSTILDQQWSELRGIEIVSVGISSISYTDESKELINIRNKGAMLEDANIREGFVQGSIAEGVKNAGSNPNGGLAGFVNLNASLGATSDYFNKTSQLNQQQISEQQVYSVSQTWICPIDQTKNNGNFCSECGNSKPVNLVPSKQMKCAHCFEIITLNEKPLKFCPECGKNFQGIPI